MSDSISFMVSDAGKENGRKCPRRSLVNFRGSAVKDYGKMMS